MVIGTINSTAFSFPNIGKDRFSMLHYIASAFWLLRHHSTFQIPNLPLGYTYSRLSLVGKAFPFADKAHGQFLYHSAVHHKEGWQQ